MRENGEWEEDKRNRKIKAILLELDESDYAIVSDAFSHRMSLTMPLGGGSNEAGELAAEICRAYLESIKLPETESQGDECQSS